MDSRSRASCLALRPRRASLRPRGWHPRPRLGRLAARLESRQPAPRARLALRERLLGRRERLGNLRQTALEHLVLELGVGDLVLELGVGERLGVCGALRLALLAHQLRVAVAQRATQLGGLLGFLLQLAHALGEIGGPHAGVAQVDAHALELGRAVGALLLGGGERHAHLGEARHHVAALLLEQAHVGVHAAEQVLHAPALLAEVAHKEALLLEQRLQLLELALLLVGTVLGKLDRGVGLVAACREAGVVGLQQAQVVNGERGGELAQALGEVAMALGLVHLALERAQLARRSRAGCPWRA